MATKKGAGTAKNLRDSNPKYLGVKRADGQAVNIGEILIRQRGTKYEAGQNVGIGKDHTLFAKIAGKVTFRDMRKKRFNGQTVTKKAIDVVA